MKQQAQGSGAFLTVVGGLVVVSLVVFGVFLGPWRALAIAGRTVSSTLFDGLSERPGIHLLPILDLRQGPASMHHDPQGGASRVSIDGVRYAARITSVDSTDLHAKRTLALEITDGPLRYPFQHSRVIDPATPDMLQDHMALWVVGEIGAAVVYDALVQVRLNGTDIGVMEWREEVGPDLERVRGASPLDVTIGANGAELEAWSSSDPVSSRSAETLRAVLSDTILTSYARRDSIDALINVDAFLRYSAAIEVLGPQEVERSWVFGAREKKFYPVVTGIARYDRDTRTAATDSAVVQWVMQEPEWRARRDRYVSEARVHLLQDDRFANRWRETERLVMPSLLRDRSKHAPIHAGEPDSYGYSVRHASMVSAQARIAFVQRLTMDRLP